MRRAFSAPPPTEGFGILVKTLDSAWFATHPDHEVRMRPATAAEMKVSRLGRRHGKGWRCWVVIRRSDEAKRIIIIYGNWPNAELERNHRATLSPCRLRRLFGEREYVFYC